jgi:hypothetical protein
MSPQFAHRVELLRCEGSDAIGAKRTCRERRERVDLTKMTHLGNGVCIAASIAMLIPPEAHLVLATIRKAVQWRDYELAP